MIRTKSIVWIAVVIGLSAVILDVTLQSDISLSRYAFALLFSALGAFVALATYALVRPRLRELESAQTSSKRNIQESEERLTAQSTALTTLMERQAANDVLEDRVPEILETCGHTIGVRRTSMWQFSEDRSAIHCVDLYDSETRVHSSGQIVRRADFPKYFAAMEHARLIAADNAHQDPSTHEFSVPYLKPNGIGAMLDVPLHQNAAVTGVMCLEHVGGSRHWTAEEQNFALSVANLLVLAITDAERREANALLAESELRSRHVIDTAHDAFVGMNSDGEIVTWNAQAKKTFGWSAEEITGKKLAETIIPQLFARGIAVVFGDFWNPVKRLL
jgi:PAS domain-containing protein